MCKPQRVFSLRLDIVEIIYYKVDIAQFIKVDVSIARADALNSVNKAIDWSKIITIYG